MCTRSINRSGFYVQGFHLERDLKFHFGIDMAQRFCKMLCVGLEG